MDMMRDDLAQHADPRLDRDDTSRERFLIEEGLEVLALYRSISDPDVRQLVRQLLVAAADRPLREQ